MSDYRCVLPSPGGSEIVAAEQLGVGGDDDDLGAASFLEQRHRKHFYFGKADGTKADYMHFRQVEQRLNARGGGKAKRTPATSRVAGESQYGKA